MRIAALNYIKIQLWCILYCISVITVHNEIIITVEVVRPRTYYAYRVTFLIGKISQRLRTWTASLRERSLLLT